MEEFKFDIDLQTIVRIILKYWQIILLAAALGGFSGWGLSKWVFTPVYEANTTIFAWESSDDEKTQKLKNQYMDIEANSRLVNDYKEIITSRKVQDEVYRLKQLKFINESKKNYKISSDIQRNTRMVKIVASSSNPEVAAFVANTTAEVFIKVIRDIMNLKSIQIIDAAELPENPVKPSPPVNAIIGFMLGLGLALLAASVKEMLDWTIKIPEEVPERIGKNVIGTIPEAKIDDQSQEDGPKNKHTVAMRTPRFFGAEKNNHAIVEVFKILRTNIEFMVPGKNKSKIVMFTSALPGEGKSTIIANLALSMSNSGKKVIILDCDLRKPFMHKFFSVDNTKGLVSIIVGAAPFQDAIHRNALNKGLDLISSGPIPPNPTELLMTDEFKQLLEELSQGYDYIFIDAPPTLNMADTSILGHLADATIFIITAGKTRIELIKRCLRQLSQTNIEISGILLNRFNIEAIKYNYYYYYYYHYHYQYNYKYGRAESKTEQKP